MQTTGSDGVNFVIRATKLRVGRPRRDVPETPKQPLLPNQIDSTQSPRALDRAALERRVRELESLCAELYESGVVIGMPHLLLNKLWTVAARGNAPRTFEVEIVDHPRDPRSLPDIRLVHDPRSPIVPPKPLPPIPLRRTVLVVDDDPTILQIVTKILSHENYELLTAPSGPLALEAVNRASTPVDLLITDYVMPGMNGRELAIKLRGHLPELKVLYQTGFTDLLFDQRPEVEPNAAFIEKPFSARGLREAARLLLFRSISPELMRTA